MIPEFLAHGGLEFVDRFVDLFFEGWGIGAFMVVVVGADFRANGESWRYGKADSGHFSKVGPFASQKGFHLAVSIGFAVPERINVFRGLAGGGLFGFGGFRFRRHERKASVSECQFEVGLASLIRLSRGSGERPWGGISRKIPGRQRLS